MSDPDLEMRPDITQDELLRELTRHSNQLLFGRDERGGENDPGELTAFRAVIIVAGILGMHVEGDVRPLALGILNGDDRPHARRCWPKMARRLRAIADDLDAMAAARGVEDEAEGFDDAPRERLKQ
jgi:hypothetical protein